jgi:hypothetical protein
MTSGRLVAGAAAMTLRAEEPRNEHGRVGQVELLRAPASSLRSKRPLPAALDVQDRREHARRVKPRHAQPVDGALRADEGYGVHVADEPVLGDRKIGFSSSATDQHFIEESAETDVGIVLRHGVPLLASWPCHLHLAITLGSVSAGSHPAGSSPSPPT